MSEIQAVPDAGFAVGSSDVWSLLYAANEQPVLYVEQDPDDNRPVRLSVWAGAYVHDHQVVARREDVVDAIGDTPDDGSVAEYLAVLQTSVDQVLAEIAERGDCD